MNVTQHCECDVCELDHLEIHMLPDSGWHVCCREPSGQGNRVKLVQGVVINKCQVGGYEIPDHGGQYSVPPHNHVAKFCDLLSKWVQFL